jgi:arylsulfatase A-like enzyme/Flp pilus assembly protein TadD
VLAILASSLLGSACAPTEGLDVILVTLDTTRADRLGVAGDVEARTPNLDRLAREGALFERAFSSVPLTLPAHTTILTGLDPDQHGVHDNGRFIVPDSLETLAERLGSRGYATGAFVSAFVLDSVFGLDQGFDVYDDDTDPRGDPLRFTIPTRRGAETTDRALAWIETIDARPVFLWVHYYDVHAPRQPPPPFDELGDPYAGELAYVDAQLGRLLEGIRKSRPGRAPLIVVVGDHGESLGEHDELTHGTVAYDSSLRVPFIVVGAKYAPGSRFDDFVRTADVAPTILAAVREPPFHGARGREIDPTSGGEAETVGYFECYGPELALGWSRIAGIRTDRWKYTATPEPVELYDLAADPGELVNRAADEPEVVARMADLYADLPVREDAAKPSYSPLSVDDQEKLAALGYLSTPRPSPPEGRTDPRQFVGLLGWIESARGLALAGRVADGIEALEIFATRTVSRPLALRSLAPLYLSVGRAEEGVAALVELAEIAGAADGYIDVANAQIIAGRPEQALETLERLDASTRSSARYRLVRTRALMSAGRLDEAEAEADRLLADDPRSDTAQAFRSRIRAARHGPRPEIERLRDRLDNARNPERMVESRAALAELLHSEGRDREAVELLEAMPETEPEHRAILAGIAVARGNPEKAVGLLESLVEDRPTNQSYRRELADVYGALGRLEESLRLYDKLIDLDPNDAGLFVDRGATRFARGDREGAEGDYRRALALDGEIPEAHLNLAILVALRGGEDEAERHLLRTLELRPDYAKAHFHLAQIYRARGDPRAADHAERAVNASAQVGMGLLQGRSQAPDPEGGPE